MSACISTHGEYSAHEPDDEFVCRLCGELDERALRAELARLRSTLPSVEDVARAIRVLGDTKNNSQQLIEESERQARAVLAMLPGRTEAEVKAEALREAAPGCNCEDDYAWLNGRADRIEKGEGRG